jgi:hypothetical protein
MTTTLTPDTNGLREIARLPKESALPRAARFLADLVKDPGFVEARILPLLAEAKPVETGTWPANTAGRTARTR